jgi:uncharacterized protein
MSWCSFREAAFVGTRKAAARIDTLGIREVPRFHPCLAPITVRAAMKRQLPRALAAVLLLALVALGIELWRSTRVEWDELHPPATIPAPPSIPYEAAEWTAAGERVSGWYVPSKNGAAVILTHGSLADRSQQNAELEALAGAGFGALAFDWPGHGLSGGKVRYGTLERAAFLGAVDWLSQRGDVREGRIGAYGFSMGGGLVISFAARDPRVRAVAAAGAYTDLQRQLEYEYRLSNPLSRAAVLAMVRSTVEGGNIRPINEAPGLKGRPVLLIAGEADQTVPAAMSHELSALLAAQLWVVPSAGHGDYHRAVGDAYEQRLVDFFTAALLPR